ncbi:hypothetical protein CVT26_000399 [Gymnopilus dilepis]|uniref:Uncharacterized protein n=1 Tax=Gymnopilus dilepis TaxID=231916 RepID=A0A409VHR2_9AGAR|nr:hypothetical protein CVT26_000399 [Gymnopilus dilepis]
MSLLYQFKFGNSSQSRPHAQMAITDDNDWMSLLTDNDVVLPSGEELALRASQSLSIFEEGGASVSSVSHGPIQIPNYLLLSGVVFFLGVSGASRQ